MPRLPAPEDYGVSTPTNSRGITNIRPLQHTADPSAGLAIGLAGNAFGEMVKKHTDELDAAKAQEALTKIRQARLDLTLGDNGAYKVKGGNVITPTFMSGYKQQMETAIAGAMTGLTPSQIAKVKAHADNELMGFQGDVLKHSMSEGERYKGLVVQGARMTETNAGILQWADPAAFEKSRVRLAESVAEEAQRAGVRPEDKDLLLAMTSKAMSPLIAGAATAAIDARNPARARELLETNRLTLDPSTRHSLLKQVVHLEEAEKTRGVSASVVKQALQDMTPEARVQRAINTVTGRATGGGFDTIIGPLLAREGGKNPNDAGKGLTNRGINISAHPGVDVANLTEAGAKEIYKRDYWDANKIGELRPEVQALVFDGVVNHGTEFKTKLVAAARGGASVEQLAQMRKEEYSRLATANPAKFGKYLASWNARVEETAGAAGTPAGVNILELQRRFDTTAEVLAAAVTSPEAVEKAKKDYKKAALIAKDPGLTPMLPPGYNAEVDGPLTFMSFLPNSRDVRAKVSRIEKEAGSGTWSRPSTAELERRAAPLLAGSPHLLKDAVALADAQMQKVDEEQKYQVDAAKKEAYELLLNGTHFAELPPKVVARLRGKDLEEVRNTFDAHFAKTNTIDPPEIIKQVNANPSILASWSDTNWLRIKSTLRGDTANRLEKQRNALKNGDDSIEAVNDGDIDNALVRAMDQLNIKKPKESSGDAEHARWFSARALLHDSVMQQQKATGKKMTEDDISKFVGKQFMVNTKLKDSFFSFGMGNVSAVASIVSPTVGKWLKPDDNVVPTITMSYADIPGSELDALKEDLQKRGNAKPTEMQLLTEYKMRKLGLRK